MTTVITIKKEVQRLKQVLIPKPENRIVVRLWMPDDDPRQKMLDEELECLEPYSRFVIKPLKETENERHKYGS